MNHPVLSRALPAAILLLWSGMAQGQLFPPLEEVERKAMSDTLQYSLEYNKTNQAATWENPRTTRNGAVVPVYTFVDVHGRPCRQFVTTLTSNDIQYQERGTACRQDNGTWYVVTDRPPARAQVIPGPPVYVYHPMERDYFPPYTYYNPFPIHFSFSYLFRGGSLRFSNYYPTGYGSLHFSSRYPLFPRWSPQTRWYPQKHHYFNPFRHHPYSRPHRRR